MQVVVLGVPIDVVTREEVRTRVAAALSDKVLRCRIVTPNPEMLVDAQKNPAFLNALQTADLAIPDATGLVWAMRWKKGAKTAIRITGADFLEDILRVAVAEHAKLGHTPRVYFLGAKGDGAARAAAALAEKIPGWECVGAEPGGERTKVIAGKTPDKPFLDPTLMGRIHTAAPDILFVAWGHPYQELWLEAAFAQLHTVKVCMGVGGSFDFYAGTIRRAPQLLRRFGFEWLWRLLQEPRRLPRILKALIVFPWLVITRKS